MPLPTKALWKGKSPSFVLIDDMAARITEKALIYATWKDRLLVFDEPDFPEILPQIPGGTIEVGETPLDAARREFTEETGLNCEGTPVFLTTLGYHTTRGGHSVHYRRHFFHIPLQITPTDNWLHVELHPTGSDIPILLHFFWIDLERAQELLGYEMAAAVDLLPK
jgi:8-oxo-dGTP pyrophosphatase MutT (NUDIX family)